MGSLNKLKINRNQQLVANNLNRFKYKLSLDRIGWVKLTGLLYFTLPIFVLLIAL